MVTSTPSALRAQRTRNRRFKACDACYQRKIKCDATALSCDWCLHHGVACTFDRPLMWDAKRKTEKSLQDQLPEDTDKTKKEQPETSSQNSELGGTSSTTNSCDTIDPEYQAMCDITALGERPTQCTFVELPLDTCPTIPLEAPNLTPEFHFTVNVICSTTSDTHLGRVRPVSQYQHCYRPAAFDLELPDPRIVQGCVDAYKNSRLRMVLPVIEPELFRETIELAYSASSGPHSMQSSAQACVFAFMQFFNSYKSGPMRGHTYNSWYAEKAQSLFPYVLRDGPTLDGLQAFVIQVYLEPLFGNEQSATYYLSLAAQFLFQLKGNTCAHPVVSRRQEHLRNLFWLCYTADKDLALRFRQSPVINDRLCDLSVPLGYVRCLEETHLSSSDFGQCFGGAVFPVDIRLSKFKSKVHSALYSANGIRKSVPELLRDIRELDEELEGWRRSLPSEWKITVLFPNTQTPDTRCIELLMLRMHYHSCVTIIHQASDRCKALVPHCHQLRGCLRSSITLSVEASRSILLYLKTAGSALPVDTFCILVAYSLSALLTVSNHVRQNPFGGQACNDLELLCAPVNTILQSMGRGELRNPKLTEIQRLLGYLTELGRVAEGGTEVARKHRGV